MDENFNTNGTAEGNGNFYTVPEEKQTVIENTPPVSESEPNTISAQPQNNTPYNNPTGAYNSQNSNSYTPNNSYGGSYNNNGGYNNSYPGPNSDNRYGAPAYNNQYSKTPDENKKKNKKGKSFFAVLICICIVIASVAIGISVSDNNSSDSSSTKNEQSTNNSGASSNGSSDLDLEDSPLTFSEYSGEGAMTSEQIYQAVKNINVGVIVYSQNQQSGEGSGIIAGEDSTGTYTYIITAAHVISDSGISVQIQLDDGTEFDADIVGIDTKTDVGVLKVKKTGLPAATFGNSDKLSVGQKVYAIGNPGGTEFFGSFTNGLISAIDRPIASTSSSYDLPCIQHNAAINPGNSGGALVNEYGQVIGLNSSKISDTDYEGMGFSVPSNTVIEIFNKIVEYGYVTNRPMLGITYYAVSSDYTYSAIAWKNNLPYGSIVIASISGNDSLTNSGIQVGDVITAVNGKNLDSTDVLLETIENGKVGDTLTLSVCRLSNNGSISSKFEATVTLVEDKGTSTTQEETVTDPFSSYFPFGY